MKSLLSLSVVLLAASVSNAAPIVLGFGPGTSYTDHVGLTVDGLRSITYNNVERGTLANLNDTDGVATGISVTTGTPFTDFGHGGGTANVVAPISAIFPAEITAASYWWFGAYTATFSGMDDSKSYTFDVLGTITDPGQTNNTTQYTLEGANSQSGTLNVVENVDKLATFTGVRSSGGLITLTVTPVVGLSYLNGVQITPVVPEPASLGLLGTAGSVLLTLKRRRM